MPQSDKSAPKPSSSGRSEFEGNEYVTDSPESLEQALRYAFDYRGDITLRMKDDAAIEGFVHNFDLIEDTVAIFVAESRRESTNQTVPASDIKAIHFSGDDKAFGQSWDDWMAKSERQRKAEAERIEKESKEMGHL
jgi:nitrous oxide reductase